MTSAISQKYGLRSYILLSKNSYTCSQFCFLEFILIAIFRVITLFVWFLVVNIILLLACMVRPKHRDNVALCGQFYSSMAKIVGLKIVIRGQENVPDEPCIFIANHQNSYDLITICRACMHGTFVIGKKSLVLIPVFGWLFWLSGCVLIDRKNSAKAADTLSSTIEKIRKRAISVWFFPEGTRSRGRGMLPFKTGAFRIADKLNLPIVRICASELHQKIKLNRWDNGTLLIELSKPISMDDSKNMKQWSVSFRDYMLEDFNRLNEEVAELEKQG